MVKKFNVSALNDAGEVVFDEDTTEPWYKSQLEILLTKALNTEGATNFAISEIKEN